MFVFIRSEPCLWTVGHYSPDGAWHAESDHPTPAQASARATRLNGGMSEDDAGRGIVESWPKQSAPAEAATDIGAECCSQNCNQGRACPRRSALDIPRVTLLLLLVSAGISVSALWMLALALQRGGA